MVDPLEIARELAETAVKYNQLWFDASQLGLHTAEEYREFLQAAKDSKVSYDSAIALCLPLSLPPFNFEIADEEEGINSHTNSSRGVTSGGDSKSNFTDHMIPTYFHRLGDVEDGRRTRHFDRNFGRAWNAASQVKRSRSAQDAQLSTRESLVNDDTKEFRINEYFKEIVLNPVAFITEPAIPGIKAESRLYGSESTSVADVAYANAMAVDLALTILDSKGFRHPLVILEGKRTSISRLTNCLEWHFYNQFERGKTSIKEPSEDELRQCVDIMRQALGMCLVFGKEEIVIHDALCAHMIQFDFGFSTTIRYKDVYDAASDYTRGPHFSCVAGPVAVIRYRSKTIHWNSLEPTIRKQLSCMAFDEYRRFKDADECSQPRQRLLKVKNILWMDEDSSLKSIYGDKSFEEVLDRASETYGGHHRSSVSLHVDSIPFTTLQDGAYVNRVVRMSLEECAKILPAVQGKCNDVVIKMLDFFNVEAYYHESSRYDVGGLDLEQFRKHCVKGFTDEIECYLRLAHYSDSETARLIHTPKMLDFGACCIRENHGHALEGYYLVLEYLEGTKELPTKEERNAAVKALAAMGIVHRDMAERNLISVKGTKYLIDFNHVKLHNISLTI